MNNHFEIFLLITSVVFAFYPFAYNYITNNGIEIFDIMWGVCFLFVFPTLIIFFLFSSSATTVEKDVVLAEPIGTIARAGSIDGIVTYIDDNGKEATLELDKKTEIYHKKGTQNRIKYITNNYYTVIGHKTGSKITKVTIYESREVTR